MNLVRERGDLTKSERFSHYLVTETIDIQTNLSQVIGYIADDENEALNNYRDYVFTIWTQALAYLYTQNFAHVKDGDRPSLKDFKNSLTEDWDKYLDKCKMEDDHKDMGKVFSEALSSLKQDL